MNMGKKKAKSESPLVESEATNNEIEATESPSPSSNQAEIEAQKSPKDLAQKLLLAGEPTSIIVEKTGLNRLQVEGLRGQMVKHLKKEDKTEPIDRLGTPFEIHSTKADELQGILLDCGFKRPAQIIALAENYGFTVSGIHQALKDSSAPNSIVRYVLRRWSAYNGEGIPSELQREIGEPYSEFHRAQESGPITETRLLEILEAREMRRTRENRLSQIEGKLGEILAQQKNGGDPKVEELRAEIKELREALINNRLSGMAREIEDLKKQSLSGDSASQIVKSIENLGSKLLEKEPIKNFVLPMSEARPPGPEASNRADVLDQLEKRGLVTVVRQK